MLLSCVHEANTGGKYMKKTPIFIIALVLMLALAACKSEGNEGKKDSPAPEKVSNADTSRAPEESASTGGAPVRMESSGMIDNICDIRILQTT